MKRKSFKKYLATRFTQDEITEIEREAELEVQALQALQSDIAHAVNKLMKQKNIGFNELVDRLDTSPAHIAKIQKGEANLTLASIARIFAVLGQEPHLVFSGKRVKG